MTIIKKRAFAILLLLFVTACAKSNTRLGKDNDGGEEGGALSDDDAQSDRGSSSGSAASSGSDRPPGTVRAGNSGQGDIATDSPMDAAVDVSFPIDSVPTWPVVSLEDAEVRQARLDLISEYCSLYEKFPCLDQDDPVLQSFNTMEERLSYCESEMEIYHYEVAGFSTQGGGCGSEWEQLLKCAIQYPYSCPCTGDECVLYVGPDVFLRAKLIGTSDSFPCIESINAFGACLSVPLPYESIEVTGKRLTCHGYVDLLGEENPFVEYNCHVICPNPSDGDRQYSFRCLGPVLGPYNCHCALNQIELYDAYSIPAADTPQQLVPDCETATEMMADGKCHDITDCCFTWVDDDGFERCGCTADVTQSSTGATTCEELAAALGGRVVDLCPQYKDISTPPR